MVCEYCDGSGHIDGTLCGACSEHSEAQVETITWGSYADVCSGWSHEDKAKRVSTKPKHTTLYVVALALGTLACILGIAIDLKEDCSTNVCSVDLEALE